MWFIACQSPVPLPPVEFWSESAGRPFTHLRLSNPAIYKFRRKKGEPDEPLPVYWKGPADEQGRKVFGDEWISDPSSCVGYATQEEAEQVAFNITVGRPWLIGHLYVTSL